MQWCPQWVNGTGDGSGKAWRRRRIEKGDGPVTMDFLAPALVKGAAMVWLAGAVIHAKGQGTWCRSAAHTHTSASAD
jgi:hypothetical protein